MQLVGVKKLFGTVMAVAGVDLVIPAGEFLTLLGPSGSGKTTLLNMIAGFEFPTDGAILIDEQPVTYVPPYKRGIGMVFQNYALFPHMTVAQNIAFPLEMRGVTRADRQARVRDVLSMVQLEGFGDRPPRQLSGGQQQRVALARALVFRPSVLLMDEPLGALDKKLRGEMQLEIKHLHRQLGLTVIYVTHDQEEALTMSDRIGVIHQGRMAQCGAPRDLYERPTNRFVASFIGDSNFLDVEVAEAEPGRVRARTVDGLTFWASVDGEVPVGAKGAVAIRPETIRLGSDAAGLENALTGRVAEVVYVGGLSRYIMHIGDAADPIAATLPNAQGTDPRPGDVVRIGWTVEAGLFLPEGR